MRSPSLTQTKKPGFQINRSLSFYYPADFVRQIEKHEALALQASEATSRLPLAELSTDLSKLNFQYRIRPVGSKHPLRIFDDGLRTYIQLRGPGEPGDAPALLAMNDEGKFIAVNFRPSQDGTWFLVDGVFPRLQLIARSGRHDLKVEIVNLRHGEQR